MGVSISSSLTLNPEGCGEHPRADRSLVLHVEYAKRRIKYGILFIFSPFDEYSNLEYVAVPV